MQLTKCFYSAACGLWHNGGQGHILVAHFIGREEGKRGVCLTRSCSPAMCVTSGQLDTGTGAAERVSWVSEPKGRSVTQNLHVQ